MLISNNHKFIFFKPLKVAGSSVEYSLFQSCDEMSLCTGYEEGFGVQGYAELNNKFMENGEEKSRFHTHTWPGLFFERILDKRKWSDYTKITIVRNPWDNVVSWYWWMMRLTRDNYPLMIGKRDSRPEAQEKFEKFLDICGDLDPIQQAPTTSQNVLDYICVNEKFVDERVDEYIRFESLNEDFNKLCFNLNLGNIPLARFKTRERKIGHHYSYYYTDLTRAKVADKFPHILYKFNYSFL